MERGRQRRSDDKTTDAPGAKLIAFVATEFARGRPRTEIIKEIASGGLTAYRARAIVNQFNRRF